MSDDGKDDETNVVELFGGGAEVIAKDPLEEAPEEADSKAQPFVDPPIEQSPVLPLGFLGGKVVFAMPEGEIRYELASKIGTMLRTDIFACQAGQTFLTYWRDREDKFLRDLATVWFVRKCRGAGFWDSGRTMRGLGVWPGADADQLVLHVGDRVWRVPARGKFEDLSIFQALSDRSGPLYRLRPPAPRPSKAVSADKAAWAREWLEGWNFEPIGDAGLTGADVVAGWLMASLLGGFAPFRGHLLLHAMAGSGKTELMLFVEALLSALGVEVIDSFTDAGLKNDLAGNARPVLIDEAESGANAHGPGVVERALELLRRMSTGRGGNRLQGDVGGGTVTQTAVGAAMVAGITPPRLGSADASRFVEVRLLPIVAGTLRTRGELEAAKAKAKALAPGLLGRALKGAWRYRADVDLVTGVMVRSGEAPRSADLVAMLIAGLRLLLHDTAMTEEEAAAEVRRWRPLLEARAASENVTNDGLDALAHLMAADTGVHRNDRRLTLGQLVHQWATLESNFSDTVMTFGLKVMREASPDGRPGPWLLVANNHPRLEAVFRGTRWSDWRRALSYLDVVSEEHRTWSPASSIRFGVGVKQRALAIPLTPWIETHSAARPVAEPDRDQGGEFSPRDDLSQDVPPTVPEEDLDWPE